MRTPGTQDRYQDQRHRRRSVTGQDDGSIINLAAPIQDMTDTNVRRAGLVLLVLLTFSSLAAGHGLASPGSGDSHTTEDASTTFDVRSPISDPSVQLWTVVATTGIVGFGLLSMRRLDQIPGDG